MANQIAYSVTFTVLCDGTSDSVALDLLKDPYGTAASVSVQNWFTEDRKNDLPTAVFVPAGTGIAATLNGTVVTVTFDTVPAAGITFVSVYLVF